MTPMSILQFLYLVFHIGQPFAAPGPGALYIPTDPNTPPRTHHTTPARPHTTQPAR